jgi:hypothetical protein
LGVGTPDDAWSAVSDVKETFEEMTRAVQATAGDPAKRKEIREVLEEAAKKLGNIAKL